MAWGNGQPSDHAPRPTVWAGIEIEPRELFEMLDPVGLLSWMGEVDDDERQEHQEGQRRGQQVER